MAHRKAKIERTIAELQAAFPLAFSTEADRIKPLQVGIKQQIYARCTLSHRAVSDALRHYTNRRTYRLKIVEGAVRVDLDGAACGNVTADDAMHAAEQTGKTPAVAAGKPKNRISLNAPANGKISPPSAMPDASKPGPRRLSLADLKQAAAVRAARAPRDDGSAPNH